MNTSATLYVIASPIGNMEDLTLRTLRMLQEIPVIACEDTRYTRRLLAHHDISCQTLFSCRSHNEEFASSKVLAHLFEGKSVAYLTDAGTPNISDPGSRLVRRVRDKGFPVRPIPGVSAVTALVSVAGIPGKGFLFEGFLSPKKGRRKKALNALLTTGKRVALYESPRRILSLLEDLISLSPGHFLCIGREMTKTYEEFFEGKVEKIYEVLKNQDRIVGEFTLLLEGRTAKGQVFTEGVDT